MKYCKALISQLIRLMLHIIKWKEQKNKRSKSWEISIKNSREEIKKIIKKKPSLGGNYIDNNWDKAFLKAKNEASKEMKKNVKIKNLSKNEVLHKKYKKNKEY